MPFAERDDIAHRNFHAAAPADISVFDRRHRVVAVERAERLAKRGGELAVDFLNLFAQIVLNPLRILFDDRNQRAQFLFRGRLRFLGFGDLRFRLFHGRREIFRLFGQRDHVVGKRVVPHLIFGDLLFQRRVFFIAFRLVELGFPPFGRGIDQVKLIFRLAGVEDHFGMFLFQLIVVRLRLGNFFLLDIDAQLRALIAGSQRFKLAVQTVNRTELFVYSPDRLTRHRTPL